MSDERTIDDGGAAFAHAGHYATDGPLSYDHYPQPGMSLRDWFAGQALLGVIAHACEAAVSEVTDGIRAGGHEARTAYAYADAMLVERAKAEKTCTEPKPDLHSKQGE